MVDSVQMLRARKRPCGDARPGEEERGLDFLRRHDPRQVRRVFSARRKISAQRSASTPVVSTEHRISGRDCQEVRTDFRLREEILASARIRQGSAPSRGVAQPGRAPALGAGSRQFESGRPDHLIINGLRGSSVKRSRAVFCDGLWEIPKWEWFRRFRFGPSAFLWGWASLRRIPKNGGEGFNRSSCDGSGVSLFCPRFRGLARLPGPA